MVMRVMKQPNRMEKVKMQLMVVERLRALKKLYSYRELSRKLNMSETVLCRYVRGSLLPGYVLAKKLLLSMREMHDLSLLIRSRVRIDEGGYLDLTNLIGDPYMLKIAAEEAYISYSNDEVTKVLTAAANGIPLATMVAYVFGVPLVIAKRTKDVGVKEFIEEAYIPRGSPIQETYYVPKRALTKDDRVLIVDDLARSGYTLRALVNIIRKAGSELVGIFILLAIGNRWYRTLKDVKPGKIKVLAVLNDQSKG